MQPLNVAASSNIESGTKRYRCILEVLSPRRKKLYCNPAPCPGNGVIAMNCDELRTRRLQTVHELVGMAAGNELTLEGSAAALRELAQIFRSEAPPMEIPLWIPDTAPFPYKEYLSAIVRKAGDGEKFRITSECGQLVLEGSDTVFASVARSLNGLSSVEPPPGTRLVPHLHFDWTSNEMVRSDSHDLVISLSARRSDGPGQLVNSGE